MVIVWEENRWMGGWLGWKKNISLGQPSWYGRRDANVVGVLKGIQQPTTHRTTSSEEIGWALLLMLLVLLVDAVGDGRVV
ncbi:hypothetical protein M0802_009764 [Mischocyttarus mexicanus]|nr:hypothetical protein M0802_009764 [Mischocyttarus mexicanus]